ncbi:MAG: gluconate 2-dehydrogenase [Bradyrhizobium sp.]|nr:gluconate 2-dehydrogenase [Bradyrhizobium sp.]
MTALVDRLIPADEEGPGPLEAGVAEFTDRQMSEPYGHGALWYMEGPFRHASPEFGYQLKYTPRELYRAALPGIDQADTEYRRSPIASCPCCNSLIMASLPSSSCPHPL